VARPIFRVAALQRYNDRFEKIVLPRYVSLPWLSLLWVCAGLLLTFTALLWASRFPIYVEGTGVVVLAPAEMGTPDQRVVAAFLPADSAAQVAVDQPVLIQFAGISSRATVAAPDDELTSVVAAVEPETLAPVVVRSRYGLDGSTGLLVTGPVKVAIIPLEIEMADRLGSIGKVKIEIGSQRGLVLLPGIGHLFVEDGWHGSRSAIDHAQVEADEAR
jgi:hypothetical protein